MKTLLLALVFTMMLAGCSDSAAQPLPTPAAEPWIVTGTSWVKDGDESVIAIEYTTPAGGGTWMRGIPVNNDMTQNWLRCWYEADIGAPLPDCARNDVAPE